MKKVATKKQLIEILKRVDKCENMVQICFLFDTLPREIIDELKEPIESSISLELATRVMNGEI